MNNLLVFGASGMAGHIVAEYFSQKDDFNVIRCLRSRLFHGSYYFNALDFEEVERIINESHPDVIVNCVGILVHSAENNVEMAIHINSLFPHFLSRMAKKYGFKLIHISTDCVFSGKSGDYAEDDFRDGDTIYARTKALGELINGIDLTIRTSIVGPELRCDGTGLLHWFLMQKGKIFGYSNVFWSGVTTLELAKYIHYCITHNITGLKHLTVEPKISKYELLKMFKREWKHDAVEILSDDSYTSDKSLLSSLKKDSYRLASYNDMLRELYLFMNSHQNFYNHYPSNVFNHN